MFKPINYGLGVHIDRQLYEDWVADMNESKPNASRILINARFWKYRIYFRWRAKHIKGKRFIIEFNHYSEYYKNYWPKKDD